MVRGGRVSWKRNDRSIRSAPSAERTSTAYRTSSEGRDVARVVAPVTHRRGIHVCVCVVCHHGTVVRQNIRAPTDEKERERENTEGARRNATGLSSPLINTSKATCKAARVGSRSTRLGEPPYPLEPSVHARHCASLSFSLSLLLYLRTASSSSSSLDSPVLSSPLPYTFFSRVHGEIRPMVNMSREIRILDTTAYCDNFIVRWIHFNGRI